MKNENGSDNNIIREVPALSICVNRHLFFCTHCPTAGEWSTRKNILSCVWFFRIFMITSYHGNDFCIVGIISFLGGGFIISLEIHVTCHTVGHVTSGHPGVQFFKSSHCNNTFEDRVPVDEAPDLQMSCRDYSSPRSICRTTMTSQWARWRLKSPASRLFTRAFIQTQIKENIKAPRHWPLWGESTNDRWIPLTKGQQHGNMGSINMHYIESAMVVYPTCKCSINPTLSSILYVLIIYVFIVHSTRILIHEWLFT